MPLYSYLTHMTLIISALKRGVNPGISDPMKLVYMARRDANAVLGHTSVYGKVA